MGNNTLKFDQLDDTNYDTWSLKMKAYLIIEDKWDVVKPLEKKAETPSPGSVSPGTPVDVKDTRNAKKMAEAHALLVLGVTTSQLAHMRSEDPREVWESLERVHRSRGFATSIALKRRFLTGTMDSGQTMQSWIGKVQKDAFGLEAAGIEVSDQDKILALTMGLPDSYSPAIISLDATPTADLTYELVVSRLLNEEARQTAGTPGSHSDREMAMHMKFKKRNGSGLKNITCYGCGQKGHFVANCPNSKTSAHSVFEVAW